MIHNQLPNCYLSNISFTISKDITRIIWIFLLPGLLLFITISCDETPGTNDTIQNSPAIESLELSPDSMNFNSDQHRVTDTTITINLSATVNSEFPSDVTPQFSVFNSDSLNQSINQGKFNSYNEQKDQFESSFELKVTTTDIKDFLVYAYYFNKRGRGNRAQHKFIVRGMAQNPPEILSTSSPDTVVIPTDTTQFRFTATVVDQEGQDNIDRVLVDIVQENGALLGGQSFRMYDDGLTNARESGDLIASDSVYTSTFSINSGNNPEDYTLHFYAFDKTGLGSDTVKTSFVITD